MADSGQRREWAKATDDTDSFPAIVDDQEPAAAGESGVAGGTSRTQAVGSGSDRPAAAAERRDRRRNVTVPELSAVRLVVSGHRGIRAVRLAAHPRKHDGSRRIRVRLSLRGGVLPPAAAVDQWPGWRRPMAGAVTRRGVVPGFVWRSGGHRAPAAGVAAVVCRTVGGPGMGQVDGAVRRISLGCSRFQPNRWSAAVDGADRWCATAVVRDRVDRLQFGCNHFRGGELVPARRQAVPARRRLPSWFQACASVSCCSSPR